MREAFALVGVENRWSCVVDDMVAMLLPKDVENVMVLFQLARLFWI